MLAIDLFVIHIFVPVDYPEWSRLAARACAHRTRDPSRASGSVSPNHPIASPACIGGSQRCFCSSVSPTPDPRTSPTTPALTRGCGRPTSPASIFTAALSSVRNRRSRFGKAVTRGGASRRRRVVRAGHPPARARAGDRASSACFGMHLDGYGLPGASAVAYGLTCMELEAGDSGVRSLVSVQGSLAMFAIWRWGSEEQKQRWLPPMHAGDAIGCFGLTEPDAGSRSRLDAHDARSATARTGSSTGRRCGSRTARSPTSRSCGRARRTGDDQRLPRRARHARLRGAGDEAQALAARVGHVGARAARRARARGEPLPGGRHRFAGRCRA